MRLDSAQGIPVPWTVGGPKWRAAVLCNSARGVIPVSHLQLPVNGISLSTKLSFLYVFNSFIYGCYMIRRATSATKISQVII